MADEIYLVRVAVNEIEQARPKIAVEWSAETQDHNVSIPQQLGAIDAAFAEEQCEPTPGAGLFAMWTGMLLLKDVMKGPEHANDERKKLKIERRDCDCC